jgi:glycosyltransferase involved in cell wall biosynthesis
MSTLSVIIITKNEEKNIRRCLESVKFADEIILVDSGSTDKTLEIAREFTSNIHSTDWPGYGQQKNRALNLATKDWLLSLDADEEVSSDLQKKIKWVLSASTSSDAYKIFRPVIFMNRLIKYASGADFSVRLFKRQRARFTDDVVHETLIVNGTTGKLFEPIYHYSFGDVATILTKMNKYTTLVAEQRAARGLRGSIFKAITHSLSMFLKVYILKRGFLDGTPGFILAVSFAEGSYYRYIKLYCLTKK